MTKIKKLKVQEAELIESEASIFYSKKSKRKNKTNSFYNDLIYREI